MVRPGTKWLGQGWANGSHAARETISCGPPALAETTTLVEFYETLTIFTKTQNFMKIVCFSSNYDCIMRVCGPRLQHFF